MSKTLPAVVCVLVLEVAHGAVSPANEGGLIAAADPELAAAPAEVDTGPLYAASTTLDRIGRIVAPVMIDGQGPFRFIVDTGANQSVLTIRLAKRLGLPASADRSITLNGVTGSTVVATVNVSTFSTGDLVQESLTLPLLESVMGGADGILGMRGFAGQRITVDFDKDFISIARSRNQPAPARYYTVPTRLRFGSLMVVDARVGGIPVKAVIDTGAQRTLGNTPLRDALLRKRKFRGEIEATSVIGVSQREQYGDYMATPTIRLGAIAITAVGAVYGDIEVFRLWGLDKEPALLIGMDVLGTLSTLVIDYRRKELQILP